MFSLWEGGVAYRAEWSMLGSLPPAVISLFCSGSLRRLDAPDACFLACSSSTKLQSRGLMASRLSGAALRSGADGSTSALAASARRCGGSCSAVSSAMLGFFDCGAVDFGGGRGGEAVDGFEGAAEREDAPERPRSALLMMVALGG